jgi:undecaprenyl-diphosphatase
MMQPSAPATTAQRKALAAAFGIGAAAVLAAGARFVCPTDACPALPADAAGLALAHGWRDRLLDPTFLAATWLGSLVVLVPSALLVGWRDWRSRWPRAAAFVPLALVGAAVLAHVAKFIADRPRPDLFTALIPMPADQSYPSAHAMQVTAFLLAMLLRPGTRPGPGAVLLACLLAALVAVSRVYLQVHFPTDVAFGIVAAALWVLALRCLPVWREGAR